VNYLVNLHVVPRPIWLCRHGESSFNAKGILGGDPELTERGQAYAARLGAWLDDYARGDGEVVVWTSMLRRTRDTAAHLTVASRPWRLLDEIDAGTCDGLTYAEVKARMPEEYAAREADKLGYRYPRGESYWDVIHRVEPVIVEIERTTSPVLVIAHQAVIRALYAYFMGLPPQDCPRLPVPLHTVIELVPQAYGCAERRMFLGPALGPG
jgi:broad specificity phosphatase PhoE